MRFQAFISESTEIKEESLESFVLKNVRSDFLDAMSKEGYLYRGSNAPQAITVEKTRMDRCPLHTPLHLHNYIDNYFNEHYGWKARSQSVFCTSNLREAKNYGNVFIILPIGDYITLHNPKVTDLFHELDRLTDYEPENSKIEDIKDDLDKVLKTYVSNNVNSAISSMREVMLGCKSYIQVPLSSSNLIQAILMKRKHER